MDVSRIQAETVRQETQESYDVAAVKFNGAISRTTAHPFWLHKRIIVVSNEKQCSLTSSQELQMCVSIVIKLNSRGKKRKSLYSKFTVFEIRDLTSM